MVPNISIIVPVFNGEKFLKEAINSILTQSVGIIDVVCIDNGSADGSLDILKSYGSQIRVFKEETRGVAAARNRGIKESYGEYIGFLDQDDMLTPSAVEVLLEVIKNSNNVGAIGRTKFLFESENSKKRWPQIDQNNPINILFNFGACLFSRRFFTEANQLNEDILLSDDLIFFNTLKEMNIELSVVPNVVFIYRQHDINTSADSLYSNSVLINTARYLINRKRK